MTGVAGTDHPRLLAILDAIAGVRVGCVGDVMLDRYVYGSVERVSPEAPVPVLKVEREARMPGGAGKPCIDVIAHQDHSQFQPAKISVASPSKYTGPESVMVFMRPRT